MSRNFNENTRVQVPAALHLCKLGYTYLDKIEKYDHSTNILTDIFLSQLAKLNPSLSEQDCKNYLSCLWSFPFFIVSNSRNLYFFISIITFFIVISLFLDKR